MNGFISDDDDPGSILISSIQNDIISLIEQRLLESGIEASNRENIGYKKTISEKGMNSINKEIYNNDIHTTCGMKCLISQEEFINNKSEIGILPCEHYFDYEQLEVWLREKPECPLCRYEMDSEDIKIDHGRAAVGVSEPVVVVSEPVVGVSEPVVGDISAAHMTINNSLRTFPTTSNLLNHILLQAQQLQQAQQAQESLEQAQESLRLAQESLQRARDTLHSPTQHQDDDDNTHS
tara:strand:- start:461 stop:1168 length:708 start_codon:yes stop_codon:yes gene_type:complete